MHYITMATADLVAVAPREFREHLAQHAEAIPEGIRSSC